MHQSLDIRTWSRTKIVATLGPSSEAPETIAELVRSGADVFRLNMAHDGPDEQQTKVENIRRVSEELNRPIGILVDLAGPKIRLGEIEGDRVFCETGEDFLVRPRWRGGGDERANFQLHATDPRAVGRRPGDAGGRHGQHEGG